MEIKSKTKKNILHFVSKKNKCPICKKNISNIFSPFCSKKCADLDLMKWLSEEQYIDLARD